MLPAGGHRQRDGADRDGGGPAWRSTVTWLLAVTRPATAEVVPNQPGFDWNRIRALSEVEALTTFPAYTGLLTDVVTADTPNPFVPADTEAMRTIETPVVLTGRLADPASPDEAVVTPAFVRSTGRGVGDTVTARLTTPAQASASFVEGPDSRPAGPAVRLSIVGVVRSLWYGDDVGSSGGLIPSPGLFARYRANFLGTAGDVPLNAIVRLRGGEADLPAFRADLARVTGRSTIDVFGLAAFLAGLVLAGQAIARLVAASAAEWFPDPAGCRRGRPRAHDRRLAPVTRHRDPARPGDDPSQSRWAA